MICSDFGFIDGKKVKMYILSNGKAKAEIITYGATVRSFGLLENGDFNDVLLGYDTLEEYAKNDGYLGAIIGRVGNRTGEGRFVLNGKVYHVGINDNGNSLHGGIKGFDSKVWDDKVEGDTLVLSYRSVDGEEGYPGNLDITVKYSLTNANGLKIEYFAVCDADTVVNFTNHAYFNLNGQGNGDILDNVLYIDADKITPVDEKLICRNEFYEVEDSVFDFRTPKRIGVDIESQDKVMKNCGGYDVNYVLNGEGFRKIAYAKSDKTGITLSVFTDQKGVQFYSGNFLSGVNGKNGTIYNKRNGFCLETQNFPNAINCKDYPNSVLKKGEKFYSVTVYELSK